MLMLGGIPWNCYFQRIQSCQTPRKAQWHLDRGRIDHDRHDDSAAVAWAWRRSLTEAGRPRRAAELRATPDDGLAAVVDARRTAAGRGIVGLTAIVGAVTSSFSASILSAGSMISWNVLRGLVAPDVSPVAHAAIDSRFDRGAGRPGRGVGACACRACSGCGSSPATWSSCCCFRNWSMPCSIRGPIAPARSSAFCVSLVLRLGGGEPILGVAATDSVRRDLVRRVCPAAAGYGSIRSGHATLFPVRTWPRWRAWCCCRWFRG